jgi:hypothetical protein
MTLTRTRLIGAATAAAGLAVLATSVAVATDDDPGRAPATPVAVTGPGVADPAGDGAGWPVVDRARIDVDGDGERDRVRLRHRTDRLLPGRVRVEAELSSGGEPAVVLRDGGLTAALFGSADPDGDADREVLLYREDGPREVTVIDWRGDRLVAVDQPERPPLASSYDRQGRALHWWVDGGDLRSSRSFDGFVGEGGHDAVEPEEYAVRVWQWRLVDGRLRAVPQGRQCVRAERPDEPFPCADTSGDLPVLLPEATAEIVPGESFAAGVGGDSVTVSLVGEVGPDTVDAGQVELVVSSPGIGTLRAPIPAGWGPSAYRTLVAGPAGPAVLVRQEGGDSSTMTVFGWSNGTLSPLRVEEAQDGPPFGGGFGAFDGETRSYTTWLTERGELFTRLASDADARAGRHQVWRWIADGAALRAEEVGTVCFDWQAGSASRC